MKMVRRSNGVPRRQWFWLALALAIVPSMALARSHAHRIVFAVSSPDENDWKMAAHNIPHLISGFQPDPVEVEVVAFGPGIAMLKKDSAVREEIEQMQKQGVHFEACENSMRASHLQIADLAPGVGTVPSGIVEIVRKQEQGWSYIKAGR